MKKFFILSTGRTATKFLAELLASDKKAMVLHEPYAEDHMLLLYGYFNAFRNILGPKLNERFNTLLPDKHSEIQIYGETTPYLRYETAWLRQKLDATTILMVRNGMDYVRSAYDRNVLTPQDRQLSIVPMDSDPLSAKWNGLTRVQQLAWYWASTNELLLDQHAQQFTKMEDILSSYKVFESDILKPTGLEVTKQQWQQAVAAPKNTSKDFNTKKMLKAGVRSLMGKSNAEPRPKLIWTDRKTDEFLTIAGPTMQKLGYSV